MHGSVRTELENLLSAQPWAKESAVSSHIVNCVGCASEVEAMRLQAQMLKSLQAPEIMEPCAGFYARVLQRIEATAKRSIWWVFVYSPVGKRLAYASLALTLALGTYVVAAESVDGHLSSHVALVQNEHYDVPVTGSADEQRAAVLENFVAHSSQVQPISLQNNKLQQTTTLQ